jgi:hypothetical protein
MSPIETNTQLDSIRPWIVIVFGTVATAIIALSLILIVSPPTDSAHKQTSVIDLITAIAG